MIEPKSVWIPDNATLDARDRWWKHTIRRVWIAVVAVILVCVVAMLWGMP